MQAPLFLIIVVIRLVLAANGRRTVGTAVSELIVQAGMLALAYVALETPREPFIALTCVVLAFPRVLLSGLCVPAGIPHVSYYVSRVVRPLPVVHEAVGSAVLDELRARVRRGFALGEHERRALDERLFVGRAGNRGRGGTLAARATLDALEGNLDSARALFRVVAGMHWGHASRTSRAFAQAWLLADAGQRGSYGELALASEQGPRTLRASFVGACARTLTGRRRHGRGALVLRWLAAPGRRENRRLLALALASEPRAEVAPSSDDLAGALDATLRLQALPPGSVRTRELTTLARLWESVLDGPDLAKHVQARRDALAANFPVRDWLERFETDLVVIFAALFRNTCGDDAPGGDDSRLVLAAKDAVQHELLVQFEAACAGLIGVAHDGDRTLEEHWRLWAEARLAGDGFASLLPERRELLWHGVGVKLMNHGVWLHNKVNAPLLAHDIFRWLLRQAPKGGENHALLVKNSRIGRYV